MGLGRKVRKFFQRLGMEKIPVKVSYDSETGLCKFDFMTGKATSLHDVIYPKIEELNLNYPHTNHEKPWIASLKIKKNEVKQVVYNFGLKKIK